MALQTPQFAQRARAAFLAGFEIPAPELAREAISVRLPRAENPVRWWMHERTRMVPPHRRSGPARELLPRRSPRRTRGVRQARGLAAPWPRQLVRLPAPGGRAVPGFGLLPPGRVPAGREVPGNRRAASRRTALHVERPPARQGHDGGEPVDPAGEVLPLLQAGSAAGGGGDPPGGGGADEDGRHIGRAGERPTGWTRSGPPRRGDDCPRGAQDRRRAAHPDRDPDARHGVAGVRGLAEEGQGRSVPRPAGGDRRAGAHRGAGVAHRAAGEAAGQRAPEGEAGGAEAGRGKVHVAARERWHLRLGDPYRDRPRHPPREGRPVDDRQLQGPLRRPQPRGGEGRLRRRRHRTVREAPDRP